VDCTDCPKKKAAMLLLLCVYLQPLLTLGAQVAREATAEILKVHYIPRDRSPDLLPQGVEADGKPEGS
jgi:hypothetical protein